VTGPGWLTRSAADVPAGDGWLGPRERAALGALTVARRRADWRLGRWTAKAAVAALLGLDPERVEVLAAPDGAPEAWAGGTRAPVSVSLSHRAGRALAAVAAAPVVVGCDLEVVEPRSAAFVREWLTEAEQARVRAAGTQDGARAANLAWTAKEAAAKVRREGLRLDVRHAESRPAGGSPAGGWRPLEVAWREGPRTAGWWREEPGWVMTLATEPGSPSPPVAL
jgi:4'-phosphopantetheinyl transferase